MPGLGTAVPKDFRWNCWKTKNDARAFLWSGCFYFSLGLLGLPLICGFIQGFVEAIRPSPGSRLRIVVFDEER